MKTEQFERVDLPDGGFIDIGKKENTFYGCIANEIMFKAQYIQRKTLEAVGSKPDFNQCLRALVHELKKQGKI
jgi:hypothetical protein